jgi:hypothetical protein
MDRLIIDDEWRRARPWATHVRILLPRVADGQAGDTSPAPALTAPLHGGETVLLVEDRPIRLDVTRTILQMHGYTGLGATTPDEALLGSDLLVTDLVMPQMSG